MSHIHYLLLALGFFSILVGLFFLVLILRSVRYAYESSQIRAALISDDLMWFPG